MNSKLFLDAMEGINEAYIVSAQKRLAYLTGQSVPHARSMKRIFTVALAAVLALICTLVAAMAVNPEFRETVISLFQIGEVEHVPGIPAGANEVRQVTIGGQVSAQYVKVEGILQTGDGETLLKQLADDGYHFYALKDEELVEVGTDASSATAMVHWQGHSIPVLFHWFIYDGRLELCDDPSGSFDDGSMTISISPERLRNRTDVVLLRGVCYGQTEGNWAWIYDLKTGEVRDVLATCGLEALGYIRPVLFSEDLRHALVRAGDTVEGTPYLADLEAKTCTPLSELMDLEIDSNTFGSYEVSFYDNDTVLLAMAPLWRPEPASVWTYHIPSGMVTPTVVHEEGLTKIDAGYDYDWSLAQKVDEDGTVTIVDLHTGGRVRLEGITAADRYYLKANDSQTKLLWAEWGDNGVSRLGVIDLETGVFTAFQREDTGVQYNEPVYWMGDNRVVTMMDLSTGQDGTQPGASDITPPEYYLCIYEF